MRTLNSLTLGVCWFHLWPGHIARSQGWISSGTNCARLYDGTVHACMIAYGGQCGDAGLVGGKRVALAHPGQRPTPKAREGWRNNEDPMILS